MTQYSRLSLNITLHLIPFKIPINKKNSCGIRYVWEQSYLTSRPNNFSLGVERSSSSPISTPASLKQGSNCEKHLVHFRAHLGSYWGSFWLLLRVSLADINCPGTGHMSMAMAIWLQLMSAKNTSEMTQSKK